ncbi:MAG: DUF1501 domain-containing protein [Actinomycetota bacterium]
MTISRRTFLGGAAGAAALGGGAWAALIRDGVERAPLAVPTTTTTTAPITTTTAAVAEAAAASSARLPLTDRVLVVLEMAGGNDALNTLVPAVGAYHDARPVVALADTELVTLAGTDHGLHPALGGLTPFWDAATMSAVAGVAMPQQSRSHFQAMDTWWSGVAGAPSQTGWLGRWLDLTLDAERNGVDDPLRAIALGGGSPALVGSTTMATAIRNPNNFDLRTQRGTDADAVIDAFLATASPLVADPTLAAAQQAIPGTLDAVELLAAASADDLAGYDNATPGAGITAVDLLATAANIIQMGIGTRVLTVGVRGFDTHAAQIDSHDALLADIGIGLERFFAALEASGDLDRVMVVTTSEFGRRVSENGSGGTDHGNGGLQFVFGPSVAGGVVHGGYDLGSLDNGDVPLAVDTRSVYRSALEWLGGPGAADGVFDELPESLPLLTV